jgi:hypothetical protein
MRNFDFSSVEIILTTIFGIAIVTLIGVGVRVIMMLTIQQRQQRMNRQINERLRTLIAAYKTLGGSFTGELSVDPRHLKELRALAHGENGMALDAGSERARRVRDAVEAALSDIILLGTQEQVRLAVEAANEMVAGRLVHTSELVVALRNYIRDALDLDAIPKDTPIPVQGPARQQTGSGGKNGRDEKRGGDKEGGMDGLGMGMGIGGGAGLGLGLAAEQDKESA